MLTLTGTNLYTDEKWSDPFDSNGYLTLLDKGCNNATVAISIDIVGSGYDAGASDSIMAESAVKSNAMLNLSAANSISLEAGFEVESGSTFTAQIESCN